MFAFLTYPVFWWLSRTWDHLTERFRYKSARKRFIKDMGVRVREFASSTAAPVAPTPAPVQPELAPAPPAVNNAPSPAAEPSAPEAPPAPAPG
jgi:hypothetical protein